ncbi:MAG TPA: UbiA-like polyprenyltransferase, partial [bacterium]|nr:UbiA-like polyprenyltransferase [bacterium]
MNHAEAVSRPPLRLRTVFDFVKLEHTLFSLPILLAGAVLAARGLPAAGTLIAIFVAGTGARTTALALNRILDRNIDARNPRTASRELPSGKISLTQGWAVAIAGLVLYCGALALLPPLCWRLAPIPLAVFVLYPLMKRFTPFAHLGVGLGLALGPIAAWVAVTGSFAGATPVYELALFTWLWVAGFDVLYATLDEEFDRREGLHSIPGRYGKPAALRIAAMMHAIAFAALAILTVRHLATFPAL